MRLLVTRPAPQGERTALALRALGHDVALCPLLRIEITADADLGPGPWAAVLMTSANAVSAVAAHPRRAELLAAAVFTVGQRTAAAARAAGFADVTAADGDVAELAQFVMRTLRPPLRLLYLAGEDRAGDLAGRLAAAGFSIDTAVVYRAVAASALPDEVARELRTGMLHGVLHFSRRSVETFMAAAQAAGIGINSLNCKHFCLSHQVAEPLLQAGVADIRLAARPEEAAVLDLVGMA